MEDKTVNPEVSFTSDEIQFVIDALSGDEADYSYSLDKIKEMVSSLPPILALRMIGPMVFKFPVGKNFVSVMEKHSDKLPIPEEFHQYFIKEEIEDILDWDEFMEYLITKISEKTYSKEMVAKSVLDKFRTLQVQDLIK